MSTTGMTFKLIPEITEMTQSFDIVNEGDESKNTNNKKIKPKPK